MVVVAEPDRVAMLSDVRASTDAVRAEMAAMRNELVDRIEQLEERLEERIQRRIADENAALRRYVDQRITDEGATTRRHFDIMVERIETAVKIVAEVNAHHGVVLDNHESRLKQIEKTR